MSLNLFGNDSDEASFKREVQLWVSTCLHVVLHVLTFPSKRMPDSRTPKVEAPTVARVNRPPGAARGNRPPTVAKPLGASALLSFRTGFNFFVFARQPFWFLCLAPCGPTLHLPLQMADVPAHPLRATQLATQLCVGRLFVGNLSAVFDDDFTFGQKVTL